MQPRPHSPLESLRAALLAALAASILAACGGGGGGGSNGTGTTAGTPPTPPTGGGPVSTVATGVMTKGSVIVNGVKFEDTTANITIDDTPKTNVALQTGMVVKLVGTVNDDGITGTAQRVNALVEVRGVPSSVDVAAQSLVLLGQTVFADDQTVYSNLNGFNDITFGPTGAPIEVHGLRDSNFNIRATRIEANLSQMASTNLDEIRGVVSGGGTATRPLTFNLATQLTLQAIDVSTAGIEPAGANWPNGTVVEVYCTRPCVSGGVFRASRLKVEDDSAFRPSPGQKMEVEGLISGFGVQPNNFSVAGTPVTITDTTRFEGGVAGDLANNVKVEAEGSFNGTRLVASKIEFKRSVVRLQGNVTAGGPQFTMDVAGNSVTIKTDNFTSGSVPAIFSGCVEVRGQRTGLSVNPPVVTAGEIRPNNCSGGGNRHLMQAPVEAEGGTTSLTLLGYPINVGSASVQFKDIKDLPILRDAFFNAVTPGSTNAAGSVPGTLVKVTFNDNATTVKEVELED